MLNKQAMQLMFVSPDGKNALSPSLEMLRAVIFETDKAYWSVGSGDAGLYFVEDGKTKDNSHPLLTFFFEELHGFFLCICRLTNGGKFLSTHPASLKASNTMSEENR